MVNTVEPGVTTTVSEGEGSGVVAYAVSRAFGMTTCKAENAAIDIRRTIKIAEKRLLVFFLIFHTFLLFSAFHSARTI